MPGNWPAKARSSPISPSAATGARPGRSGCRRTGQGIAVIKPELLDEVTALVEWPVALAGNFERRFLDVPAEALISTMQDNQRYFPVVDARPAAAALHHHDQSGKPRSRRRCGRATNG
jgi:hypothetical protein